MQRLTRRSKDGIVLPYALDKVSISVSWSSSVINFCLNSKTKRPMFLSLYDHPTSMLQGDTRVLLQVLDRNKLYKCGWGTSSSNERVYKNILRPNSSRSCFQINCPSYAKCLTLLIERLRGNRQPAAALFFRSSLLRVPILNAPNFLLSCPWHIMSTGQ